MTGRVEAAARRCAVAALLALTACGAGGDGPHTMAPRESDGFAYVTVSSHAVNADGSVSDVQADALSGTSPESIAVHPTGRYLYVSNFLSFDISEFAIDPVDGTLTPLRAQARTVVESNPLFVSVHPSGPAAPTGSWPVSVVLDPLGRFAYAVNSGSGDISVYSINAVIGVLTPVGSRVPTGRQPTAMALAPRTH